MLLLSPRGRLRLLRGALGRTCNRGAPAVRRTSTEAVLDKSFGLAPGEEAPEAVAALVAGVVPGWKGVPVGDVSVKDFSAFGGARVYKVSASTQGATPPAVCLKVDVSGDDDDGDNIQDDRSQAAAAALGKRGMAPTKIVKGNNWDCEEWSGVSVAKDFSHFDDELAPLAKLAKLMADVHAIPTDWYEPFRVRMLTSDRAPFLQSVPPHAPFWNGAAFGWENGMLFTGGKMTPEKAANNKRIYDEMCASGVMEALVTCEAFYPQSAAGRRVATIHGDFKPNNVIGRPDGSCMCIDYDFTHVSPVQQELSFAFMKWLGPKHQDYATRYDFLEQYLLSSGQPHDNAAVKELMLDAMVGTICNFDGLLFSGLSREVPLLRNGCEPDGMALIKLLSEWVAEVRASPTLKEMVLYNGPVPTMYVTAQGALKSWLEEMRAHGSLGGFGVFADAETWEENVRTKAVRTPWIPLRARLE